MCADCQSKTSDPPDLDKCFPKTCLLFWLLGEGCFNFDFVLDADEEEWNDVVCEEEEDEGKKVL